MPLWYSRHGLLQVITYGDVGLTVPVRQGLHDGIDALGGVEVLQRLCWLLMRSSRVQPLHSCSLTAGAPPSSTMLRSKPCSRCWQLRTLRAADTSLEMDASSSAQLGSLSRCQSLEHFSLIQPSFTAWGPMLLLWHLCCAGWGPRHCWCCDCCCRWHHCSPGPCQMCLIPACCRLLGPVAQAGPMMLRNVMLQPEPALHCPLSSAGFIKPS